MMTMMLMMIEFYIILC